MDMFSLMVYHEDGSELENLFDNFKDARDAFFGAAETSFLFPSLGIAEASLELQGFIDATNIPKDLEIFATEDRPLNRHMYTMYWVRDHEEHDGPIFYFWDFITQHLTTFNDKETKELYQLFFSGVKIGI
jgi:hypothetical protein